MIINEISLKNFQCYFGEHNQNKLKFSGGVNLIVGNNGGGKSKLFDAFYWVIYNQVFQSDRRAFIATSQYKENLISDKAKAQAAIGENITSEVTLSVRDSQDREFRITRIYKAVKVSDREWKGNPDSELLIQEIKSGTPQLVQPARHQPILDSVIPGHLKPYMWFQGEQVDSLMDLTNRSALQQTINLLSDISDYDKLIEVAEKGSSKANAALSKARKNSSKNQAESEKWASLETQHRAHIFRLEREVAEHKASIQNAIDGVELIVGQLADAKKKIELKQQRATAENERKSAESSLEQRLKELNSRLFRDLWLLKNVEPYSDKFLSKYKQYNSEHLETLAALKLTTHRLPVDMPRPVHIQEMLEAHECFVCGRSAEEGSEAFKRIESLLNREKPNVQSAFKNDCSKFFEKLYENAIELRHTAKSLNETIPREFKVIQELRGKLKSASERLRVIDEQFEELVRDDTSEDIVAEYNQHESNRAKYEAMHSSAEQQLRDHKIALAHAINEQAKLTKGKIDPAIELGAEVWSSLASLTLSTKEFVFTELVTQLEGAANQIFTEMTARNRSITGRLQLKIVANDKVLAEIVDADGFPLAGSNDSNIILVKLSLMMAILKSRDLWSKNYSMVTDAPTSKMAAEYSQGFYESLSDNFSQSIVMTYDFLNPNDLKGLEGVNLGKVYKLDAHYPGGNREDRSDLSVNIVEVMA